MKSCKIHVRLTPRASRNEILGWEENTLRVRLAAPPVDGRANEALIRILSEFLRAPRSSLRLVQGTRSRDKVIEVVGLTEEEMRARLGR